MPIDKTKYDDIFKRAAQKYQFGEKKTLVLKAVVQVESYWNERAYRFEPALFQTMKAKDPFWADKDPAVVSASYGLAQILFTTAWNMGLKPPNWASLKHEDFQKLADSLYDPEKSIFLETQLISMLIANVWAANIPTKWEHLSALQVALARYNGGSFKNPDENGMLRNQSYVDKVWRAYKELGGLI